MDITVYTEDLVGAFEKLSAEEKKKIHKPEALYNTEAYMSNHASDLIRMKFAFPNVDQTIQELRQNEVGTIVVAGTFPVFTIIYKCVLILEQELQILIPNVRSARQ